MFRKKKIQIIILNRQNVLLLPNLILRTHLKILY
ncbi:MAG: hypothetical protein MRERV_8c030 [Mycoplasmataceae bacterium RV_VA103A]|nr:MAG: hypothetical protein MRERV_8c030 [Mycoplasmataceae bacterium RV_VA103A]